METTGQYGVKPCKVPWRLLIRLLPVKGIDALEKQAQENLLGEHLSPELQGGPLKYSASLIAASGHHYRALQHTVL